MRKEFNVLREFLNMSVFSPDEVFAKFQTDLGGNLYEVNGKKFYFKPGTRKDRILLVAHADTVWDNRYNNFGLTDEDNKLKVENQNLVQNKVVEDLRGFRSGSLNIGLGADDRAGAAIVWLLKDSGNSILITDNEEIGALSARNKMANEDIRKLINSHRYMLQFDLKGKKEFKCYGAGSDDFKVMLEIKTKYDMLPNYSFTDISVLGQDICGANLSVGYKNEHTPKESLNKRDWYNTYKIAKKLSKAKHQQFYVEPDFAYKYMREEEKKEIEEYNNYIAGLKDRREKIDKYFDELNNNESEIEKM